MRTWVYNALYEVIVNKTYSNLYLKNHLNEVNQKDRALATNIFYGTIQNYLYCQYVWKQYAKGKVSQKVSIILSMSVYQLLFLDKIPVYAIINEGVNLTKKVQAKASGMVNAILHKIDKDNIQLPKDEIERMSIVYSLPEWLLKMWKSQYGMELTKQMAMYSNQNLSITLRWNQRFSFEENEYLIPLDNGLYEYIGTDFSNFSLYKKGMVSAQDYGSYQICQYVDARPGMKILDTCAAPGTKSMALAEKMDDIGWIDSLDLHAHRVKLIEQDAKRLNLSIIHAHCQDSTHLSEYGMYDRVLCDVPCSGYGVLSRKPDIKLNMNSSDMDSLIPLQYAILSEACKHVKRNGVLVYSTCTMNKKENEKQIEKFLKEHSNFTKVKEETIFPDKNIDGFYMCQLKCVL